MEPLPSRHLRGPSSAQCAGSPHSQPLGPLDRAEGHSTLSLWKHSSCPLEQGTQPNGSKDVQLPAGTFRVLFSWQAARPIRNSHCPTCGHSLLTQTGCCPEPSVPVRGRCGARSPPTHAVPPSPHSPAASGEVLKALLGLSKHACPEYCRGRVVPCTLGG